MMTPDGRAIDEFVEVYEINSTDDLVELTEQLAAQVEDNEGRELFA
jgi:hypothetical protein